MTTNVRGGVSTRAAESMFNRISVIGRGRVGAAISARLRDQGRLAESGPADLILLCVPDSAIGPVARETREGPWIAHVSGATPLAALDPHRRRFGMHPLQTFTRARGPEQIDGAWAAVTGETDEARARGRWLAGTLGLTPFDLAEANRVLYHAGAVMASNYVVTLYRAAARAFAEAGVPAAALLPLMRRTIDNDFELTGPISRGDWAVVDAHLAALAEQVPELEPLYRALAKATAP
jgi:predicted short-subunit dehydrogenase-like oxidoreductase (DUF2520 family)